MDFNRLTMSAWFGFRLGLVTMFTATLIFIPASYIMNKYIYHHPIMRVVLGTIAGVLSIVSFAVISILLLASVIKPVHYFGLMPAINLSVPVEPTGYFAFIMKFIIVLIHPFYMFYSSGDIEGYKDTIKQCLVPEGLPTLKTTLNGEEVTATKGVVCEEFFNAAREAGTEKDKALWQDKMKALYASGISSFIFS